MGNETQKWADGPLHEALVEVLPTFVKEPFSESPHLDVPKLHKAVGKSHETVYKWLRANRLNSKNVIKLVEVANTEENVAALNQLGRDAPQIEYFTRFLFA